jgi:hypothetical protein
MFKQKVLNFCENSYMVKSIKILVCYNIRMTRPLRPPRAPPEPNPSWRTQADRVRRRVLTLAGR